MPLAFGIGQPMRRDVGYAAAFGNAIGGFLLAALIGVPLGLFGTALSKVAMMRRPLRQTVARTSAS